MHRSRCALPTSTAYWWLTYIILGLGIAFTTLTTSGAEDDRAQLQQLLECRQLIQAGRFEESLREIDRVLKFYEEKYATEKRKVYCARTKEDSLMYLVSSAAKQDAAIVVSYAWSDAHFMCGYVLQNLRRLKEAKASIGRAVELSPSNAQYLGEMAHLLQLEKQWSQAQELFKRAEESARACSPEGSRKSELTRALRGQGYNLVELGQLDAAEAKYHESLKIDPQDKSSAAEISFIADLRKKKAKS